MASPAIQALAPGRTYSWEELGRTLSFNPWWLNRVGGMASLRRHDAVLVITHPQGGQSFDYDDRWDGTDLIYTGKGQEGHQRLVAENRYVADNTRTIIVFEHAGPAALKYLGVATCTDVKPDVAPDRNGAPRRIYRFRLSFDAVSSSPRPTRSTGSASTWSPEIASPERRPRRFDPSKPPRPPRASGRTRRSPEDILAMKEKADRLHHQLVSALLGALASAGWEDLEEIPSAVDLWGREPESGIRVIFEAKTFETGNDLRPTRSALAQLLEYRLLYGEPDDELCLVASNPISDRRVHVLNAVGIDAIWNTKGRFTTRGQVTSHTVRRLLTVASRSTPR